MSYYDYRDSFFDRHFTKIMTAFFVTVVALISIGIHGSSEKATAHYKQCLDDGKKEYQCYSIVYGGRR
jgi:hypothetical protein